jgi:hypothetical protein
MKRCICKKLPTTNLIAQYDHRRSRHEITPTPFLTFCFRVHISIQSYVGPILLSDNKSIVVGIYKHD